MVINTLGYKCGNFPYKSSLIISSPCSANTNSKPRIANPLSTSIIRVPVPNNQFWILSGKNHKSNSAREMREELAYLSNIILSANNTIFIITSIITEYDIYQFGSAQTKHDIDTGNM